MRFFYYRICHGLRVLIMSNLVLQDHYKQTLLHRCNKVSPGLPSPSFF